MACSSSSRLGCEFHVLGRVLGEKTSGANLGPSRPDIWIATEFREELLLRNAALDERIEALDEEDSTHDTIRVCWREGIENVLDPPLVKSLPRHLLAAGINPPQSGDPGADVIRVGHS